MNKTDGSSAPLPQWDLVYRDPRTNALVNNWTRMDATLDAFVANGIIPSPIVLDNVPYAFVREENRFYGGFGLGSAPDNKTEFATWVGDQLIGHLVQRYGKSAVSAWRFRLGTEADGPRMGPRWAPPDGNGPIGMPTASGAPKTFSNGLDQYVETYIAVRARVCTKSIKCPVNGQYQHENPVGDPYYYYTI